jgi:hypothetical protein
MSSWSLESTGCERHHETASIDARQAALLGQDGLCHAAAGNEAGQLLKQRFVMEMLMDP